jgi:penicillin-binding protein 1C
MEYYYRSYHPEYRGAPPWRGDCDVDRSGAADKVIGIVYPPAQTSIYIPVQLDGSRGKAVFKIVHRDPSEKVFWHIDDRFMGATTLFHELEVDVAPGEHLLTVVDEEGSRAERRFTVLEKGEEAGRTPPLR